MNDHETYARIKQLFAEIHSGQIREAARHAGDESLALVLHEV